MHLAYDPDAPPGRVLALHRQTLILSALLVPVTVFLGVFFQLPLLIIALFSLLSPGLGGYAIWSLQSSTSLL